MENMSKTAALAAARKSVGSINRRSSTDYVFYDCGGPSQNYSTEVRADSYKGAVLKRAARVALNAMEYMGINVEDANYEISRMEYYCYASPNAVDMLNQALKAAR